MNKLDELTKYLQEHPELIQKLENASQEDGIKMILDTNIFSSEEEFHLSLENQKVSDQELGDVSGGLRVPQYTDIFQVECLLYRYHHGDPNPNYMGDGHYI